MSIEEVAPNKPKVALVGYLTIATLLLILVGAVVIVAWRAKQAHKTPYSRHPTSQLMEPAPNPAGRAVAA